MDGGVVPIVDGPSGSSDGWLSSANGSCSMAGLVCVSVGWCCVPFCVFLSGCSVLVCVCVLFYCIN